MTLEEANEMDKECRQDVSNLLKKGRRRNFVEIPCLKCKKPKTPSHIFLDNPNNTVYGGLYDTDNNVDTGEQ